MLLRYKRQLTDDYIQFQSKNFQEMRMSGTNMNLESSPLNFSFSAACRCQDKQGEAGCRCKVTVYYIQCGETLIKPAILQKTETHKQNMNAKPNKLVV